MKYFAYEKNQTTGPHTLEELRAKLERGELTPTDRVCLEGTENWTPLATILQQAPSPYLSAPQHSPAPGSVPPARKKGGCAGCLLTGLVIFAILIVGLIGTTYYMLFHTAFPLRMIEKVASTPNFSIKGISGSLSSGYTIQSIHIKSDNGDVLDAEDLKFHYSGISDYAKRHEIILNELSVGKATLIVAVNHTESYSQTSGSSNPPTSQPRPASENDLKLFRIDRIHFANVYIKDRTTGFEFTMPEFDYSGFKWTPESLDLGNLRIDTDRLNVTTKPGRTATIEGKQVAFQKLVEGTVKPLLHRSIKQPINLAVDIGQGESKKLFYRLSAFDGRLESYFDEESHGYYKIHDLPLSSYLALPPYDLPSKLTLNLKIISSEKYHFDREQLPTGQFTLGVTDFTLAPDKMIIEEHADQYHYDFKATHRTANGEIVASLLVQSEEPHLVPSFSSTPAMEPAELLAQIFYGKSASELQPNEKAENERRLKAYFPVGK